MSEMNASQESAPLNFLAEIIEEDLRGGYPGVATRFPPEPNGYLHIGHAKSICINFGLAQQFGGTCNLRFDDTNPEKEDTEYVDAIKEDISWLGFGWNAEHYASDYFDQLYLWAEKLILDGKAYICSLTPEEMSLGRATPQQRGTDSPTRCVAPQQNLELFRQMRDGKFAEGQCCLRAKIDMGADNMQLRDPVIYRIKHAHHHRTGDKWCIYPTYDFAHGQSDYIEQITHSICTLEFEVHRPLYEWLLEQVAEPGRLRPKQREFARLNISNTVMSKRRLLRLVTEGYVSGWDDPRMPTISGLRRRGYTPESIRLFIDKVGVSRRENLISLSLLEFCIRTELNKTAARYMGVINPLKVIIENYPEGQTEQVECVNNPEDPAAGTRLAPFGRELYIERDDFMEVPPKGFHRLSPGKEVRLRYGYFITCTGMDKDGEGNITALRCTYDPLTRGGEAPDGRSPKATIHWVEASNALPAEIRLYETLFCSEVVPEGDDWIAGLNPNSLTVRQGFIEPAAAGLAIGQRIQFERMGYFCLDKDSAAGKLAFNRIVTLKDSWAKQQDKAAPAPQPKQPKQKNSNGAKP